MGNNDDKSRWTPEVLIQVFKEVVTALIGLVIVFYTIRLAWNTFEYAGEVEKMKNAKDILLLMLGLAGVVLGYYFGRVPADARATQAQEQANVASAQTEHVTTQAQVLADKVDKIAGKLTSEGGEARSFDAKHPVTNTVDDLHGIRDELHSLSNAHRSPK